MLVRSGSDFSWIPAEHVEVLVGDVTNGNDLKEGMTGCKYVVHAAAYFRFWGDEEQFTRVNFEGTKKVVRAAQNHDVERFVYISSIAVVGKPEPNVVIDEEVCCHPQTPYQRTKYRTEQWVQDLARQGKLPAVILRPGAFYGPGRRYGFNRLFVIEAMKGWRVKVEGGRRLIFPVFVPDVARAVVKTLTLGRIGEVYNICDRPYSHNQVNEIASRLLGFSNWRLNVPKWIMLALAWLMELAAKISHREPFYPLNLRHYVFNDWNVSNQKAVAELGFSPTPMEEGMAETVAWLHTLEKMD
jgi:nucleoside-diphosphate-sugar epimerase